MLHLAFRWNQPRRPERHYCLFFAPGLAEFRERAQAALLFFEPSTRYPLVLQSLQAVQCRDGHLEVRWSEVGPVEWPREPMRTEEHLAIFAADVWDQAVRRFQDPGRAVAA